MCTLGGSSAASDVYKGRVTAGSVSKTLVEFSDFVPTVAEATGVAPLSPTDGRSFLPQLPGTTGTPRDTLFVYTWAHPGKSRPHRLARD